MYYANFPVRTFKGISKVVCLFRKQRQTFLLRMQCLKINFLHMHYTFSS